MSQSMQNSSGMNAAKHSVIPAENEDPLAQADTLKVVSCPICHAVYIPSSRQQTVVRGPASLLESAFLAICHFCFRCQRPSCPQCWNPIHHACASCSEEARLPFRAPVPSLEGLIFSALDASQEAPLSFTCLRDGTFYLPATAPHVDSAENKPAAPPSSSSYPVTSGDLPALHPERPAPAAPSSYPAWLREAMDLTQKGSPSATDPQTQVEVNDSAILPAQTGTTASAPAPLTEQISSSATPEAPSSLARPSVGVSPQGGEQPVRPSVVVSPQIEQNEVQDGEEEEEISLFERIENVLIIVVSFLLLAILLMIILALSSADMNSFFFRLLHIDIRTEILYLLQLR